MHQMEKSSHTAHDCAVHISLMKAMLPALLKAYQKCYYTVVKQAAFWLLEHLSTICCISELAAVLQFCSSLSEYSSFRGECSVL